MLKLLKKLIKFILLCLLLAGGLLGVLGYKEYKDALKQEPLDQKLGEIRGQEGYVSAEELPSFYLEAVICTEDHRFYHHFGIDPIALGRAAKNNLLSGSMKEGGSTITQQLAKNLYFTQEKKLVRKAAEAFMALKLEKELTKEEILELYVNTIYFGEGAYGIGEASLEYFGKEPSKLSAGEAAMLAGLPNAPSAYAPTQHPQLAAKRQEHVIRQMVKYGALTEEEAKKIQDR